MMIKKLLLGAVVAAMPLTALGAAPAWASEGGYDNSNDPEVSVSVDGHDVEVTYTCYTEDDNGDGGDDGDKAARSHGDDGDNNDEYGTLTVYYHGDHWRKHVLCDGEEGSETFYVHGHGKFKAVLKDPDGDKAYDSAYVKDHHHHHHH
jgi:hypothetical protein